MFVVLWWLGIYFVAGSGFWILVWFGIVREFRFVRVLIYVGDCSCCVVCLWLVVMVFWVGWVVWVGTL